MSIFIMGDCHYGSGKDGEKLKYCNAKKGDYVIVCGDAGFIWDGGKRDTKVIRELSELPFTILFCDGNHENFNVLNAMPVIEFNGAKAHKISNNIYHILRGEICKLENKTFLFIGGAASIDKMYRVKGVSWWEEELPNTQEIDAMCEKLLPVKQVDYIITHQCPLWINNILYWNKPLLTEVYFLKFLNELYDSIEFKDWYAGHHHIDRRFDKCKILYNSIVKIGEGV